MAVREKKRIPVHPGRVLRSHYLEPLGITLTELAEGLRVSRKTVSKIVNEHGSITPDMAMRLSVAFDTTPDLWLNLQKNYDLWHATYDSTEWQKVRKREFFKVQGA